MATITGARVAISDHVTSGVTPPGRRGSGPCACASRVHRATPTSAWASMASVARRYSSSSQSTLRCDSSHTKLPIDGH